MEQFYVVEEGHFFERLRKCLGGENNKHGVWIAGPNPE